MVQVIWTQPALNDLRDIVQHISQDSAVYAERFAHSVVQAPKRLARFPHSGRVTPEFGKPGIRELIYGSYRIIYVIRRSTCYIVAVVHGSRDILRHLKPGTWDVT